MLNHIFFYYYKFCWKYVHILKVFFSEWITSVICLPLLSLGKASSGTNPDWTCIIVGFNTGFIRFYTEVSYYLS